MSKTIIAVHLGEINFTAVEIKVNNGGAEMLRYTIHQLPESGFSGEWLAGIWKKEYFSHTKVIVLLPQDLVRYKTLTLPSLPDEQLRAGVRLEMDNSEPGAVYRITNVQKGEQNTSVKLALVKDNELESYLKRFVTAGLTIEWAGLNHHGLQNFLAFNLDFFEGSGADVYLTLNESSSEFGALTDTELLFRRTLLIGGRDLKEDPSVHLTELSNEIRLSLASYQATNKMPLPEKIWLFGETKPEQEWLDHLSTTFGVRFQVSDKTRLSGVITGNHTSELAPLIGLALDEAWLSRKDWRFNTNEQARREDARLRVMMGIKAGLAGALLIGGLLLGTHAKTVRDRKNTAWLHQQKAFVAQLRRAENETNRKVEQIKTLEEWLGRRGRELEFLRAIEACLPEQTQVKDLIIEDGIIKSLSGSTRSVSTLLEKLQRTPELKTFKLKGTITTDKNGMELFQLEGRFTPEEKTP